MKLFSSLLVTLMSLSLPLLGATELTPAPETPAAPICHASEKPEEAGAAHIILAGYGAEVMVVTTQSPRAQAFFNNGLQLAHAFAHDAATSAFERAELIDPTCAMCVWGEAWSRGPTINFGIDDVARTKAAALAKQAVVLSANAPIREQLIIAALQVRYAVAGGDQAFAEAMDALARAYPRDSEMNVIAADAWLIVASGRQDQDDDRAIALLQSVLQRSPNDVGAIHFYIHATEDRGNGTLALPYAARLHDLAPSASHLIHMPSHTFFWAGQYQQAEVANLEAMMIDQADADRLKYKKGVFGARYHGHNLQYGEAAAIETGDAQNALRMAAEQLGQLPKLKPDNFWQQTSLALAYSSYGRFASQQQVVELADPGEALPYARVLWHYARGEAAARRGDIAAIKDEEKAMTYSDANAALFGNFSSNGIAMTKIARMVLEGRVAMMEGRYTDAVSVYGDAAKLQEDELSGISDPPAWWYPVRRGLAAAYMAEGDLPDAEREAKTVLARFPDEPLTLQILASIEDELGQPANAAEQSRRKQSNWLGDGTATPTALL